MFTRRRDRVREPKLEIVRFLNLEKKAVDFIEAGLLLGVEPNKIEEVLRNQLWEYDPLLKLQIDWNGKWVRITL